MVLQIRGVILLKVRVYVQEETTAKNSRGMLLCTYRKKGALSIPF